MIKKELSLSVSNRIEAEYPRGGGRVARLHLLQYS